MVLKLCSKPLPNSVNKMFLFPLLVLHFSHSICLNKFHIKKFMDRYGGKITPCGQFTCLSLCIWVSSPAPLTPRRPTYHRCLDLHSIRKAASKQAPGGQELCLAHCVFPYHLALCLHPVGVECFFFRGGEIEWMDQTI